MDEILSSWGPVDKYYIELTTKDRKLNLIEPLIDQHTTVDNNLVKSHGETMVFIAL